LETLLDGTLVCGPHVLEPEQHYRVAIGTKRVTKDVLIWSSLLSDLVITRLAIEKG
jgi:hypothetical protein